MLHVFVEKQQMPIFLSSFWPNLGLNLGSTTLEESMPTISPPMRFFGLYKIQFYSGLSLDVSLL
jgi:hypothetical protein